MILLLPIGCEGGAPGSGWGRADTAVETLEGTDTGIPGVEAPARVPDVLVDCMGGADFQTIQEAIEGSLSGTKIGLLPCTYHEDVDFKGKSLDIFGTEGSSVTTIVGSGYGPAVKATHGESLGTRLAGVTVTGGVTEGYYGSGLNMELAVLELEDVVFTHNDVGYSVLYAAGAFLDLVDVTFTDNTVTAGGGILVADDGSLVAQRLAVDCQGADFAIYGHLALLILDSDIACGNLYGIKNAAGYVHVRRSRVTSDGIALFGGDSDDTRNERVWLHNSVFVGGELGVSTLYMDVEAENNVFWGGEVGIDLQYPSTESFVRNSVADGSQCPFRTNEGAILELGWNAMDREPTTCGTLGHDSVVGDPALVNPPDDFSLKSGSPLIDAGDPDEDRNDADGSRNDIGHEGGPEGEGQR